MRVSTTSPVAAADDVKIPTRRILAWGLWDWAFASFNAVATTFVFSTYLASTAFGNQAHEQELYGLFLTIAGIAIAVIAPVIGQRADTTGSRRLWLGINSGVVVLCLLGTVFVKAEPGYLFLGLACIAIGTVFYELAGVNYNSMLPQVSTPKTIGRVSGFGWSMGYFGGIVLLILILVLFVLGGTDAHPGLLGISSAGGLNIRIAMLLATLWAIGFAIPVFFAVKTPPVSAEIAAERTNFFASYVVLFRNIATLWKENRNTLWFLLASAIFRDGLTGVFTVAGSIGIVVFGFTTTTVLLFGVAANIAAGIATVSVGRLDDRFGPKPVIVTSLIGMSVCALVIFVLHSEGAIIYWVFGLILALFVGPAQSASRTFLGRIIPAGREGEVFGLYATTGRAAIWISPLLYSTFIALSPAADSAGKTVWGILGILVVVLVGLFVLLPVKPGQEQLGARGR